MFKVLNTLSESRLIPSQSTLRNYDAEELAELVVLYVCALYIMEHYSDSKTRAQAYAKRTIQYGTDFDRWRISASDLYAILYALLSRDVNLRNPRESDRLRENMPLGTSLLIRWLKAMATNTMTRNIHRALFARLDYNFKINNSSIRAVRRAVMDWEDLDSDERRMTMTRILQLMRARAPKSEVLPWLRDTAAKHHLDISTHSTVPSDYLSKGAPERKEGSLLVALAGVAAGVKAVNTIRKKTESASSGATGAASVATVATPLGGIGVGFDPKGDKGIYQGTKKKKPLILRR